MKYKEERPARAAPSFTVTALELSLQSGYLALVDVGSSSPVLGKSLPHFPLALFLALRPADECTQLSYHDSNSIHILTASRGDEIFGGGSLCEALDLRLYCSREQLVMSGISLVL